MKTISGFSPVGDRDTRQDLTLVNQSTCGSFKPLVR